MKDVWYSRSSSKTAGINFILYFTTPSYFFPVYILAPRKRDTKLRIREMTRDLRTLFN